MPSTDYASKCDGNACKILVLLPRLLSCRTGSCKTTSLAYTGRWNPYGVFIIKFVVFRKTLPSAVLNELRTAIKIGQQFTFSLRHRSLKIAYDAFLYIVQCQILPLIQSNFPVTKKRNGDTLYILHMCQLVMYRSVVGKCPCQSCMY